MIRNAILYVLRKKTRTVIIFIILTVVLSFLYSCLNIMKLINNLENNLYKISNTSISITKKNDESFELNEFKEIENVQEVKKIITQYDGLAKAIDTEPVDGMQNVEIDYLQDEMKNLLSVEAINNTENDILFYSGIFTIIEGRHIEKDDRGKILIHEELAKKNSLHLNNKIKLELLELDKDKAKEESEFEIIGIFSGKKQEIYTGLSSDFSENMVFIDYESSQIALNKTKEHKIVNKISVFSDDLEESNISYSKIKEIKTDWSKYSISKDNNVFEETLKSVEGIKHIIKIMLFSIMLGGVTVISLILILWLRERIYEIGILLSIGISKIKIIAQFMFELVFISLPAIVISLFLGNLILNQIISGFIDTDSSTLNIKNLLQNNQLISKLVVLLQSYGILISIIAISVTIACTMIVLKKPKEILSKIS